MKTGLMAILLSAAAAAPSFAVERTATARDYFYEWAVEGDSQWTGVRTSIVLRAKDSRGVTQVKEVSEQYPFQDGDRFRIRVQSNIDGYVYLFLRDSDGKVSMLYPEENRSKANKLLAYRSRPVPGKETEWFRFDQEAGLEQIYLFLSPERIDELEKVAASGGSWNQRQLERLIARAPRAQSMTFEEEGLEDHGDVGATYYVEKDNPKRPFLVRRFDLIHRSK